MNKKSSGKKSNAVYLVRVASEIAIAEANKNTGFDERANFQKK